MVATPMSDPAAPIRYALTHRPAADDRVDIVLDLFRGTVAIHSRTVARVPRMQAVLVMVKCRRYLDLRGVLPAGPLAPPAAAPLPAGGPAPAGRTPARTAPKPRRERAVEPRAQAPVAAFDWMFEAG